MYFQYSKKGMPWFNWVENLVLSDTISIFLCATYSALWYNIITAFFPPSSSGFQEASINWRATCTTGVSSWGSMGTWAHTPVGATLAPHWTRLRWTLRPSLTGRWICLILTAVIQMLLSKSWVRAGEGTFTMWLLRCCGFDLVWLFFLSWTGYPLMSKALNATGRPIGYSCSWPAYQGGLPPKV